MHILLVKLVSGPQVRIF